MRNTVGSAAAAAAAATCAERRDDCSTTNSSYNGRHNTIDLEYGDYDSCYERQYGYSQRDLYFGNAPALVRVVLAGVVVVVVADAVAVVVPSVATTIPTAIIVGPTTQSGSKHDCQEVDRSILHADYSFVETLFQECDKIYARCYM
jgi:hypothetical protein